MVPVQVLRRFSVFKGLEDSELARISDISRQRTVGEGAICFTQNRQANELHLCLTGSVNIIVKLLEPWGREVTIYKAKAGDIFGWSAVVEPYVYTSSAKCAERTEEIYIKGSELLKLFDENPHTGYAVMKNLAAVIGSRLTETRQQLSKEQAAAIQQDYEW